MKRRSTRAVHAYVPRYRDSYTTTLGEKKGGGVCSDVPASSLRGSPFYNPKDVRKSEDVVRKKKKKKKRRGLQPYQQTASWDHGETSKEFFFF